VADGWDFDTCLTDYAYRIHGKFQSIFTNDIFSSTAKFTPENVTSLYLQLVLLK
jgi:hypothetical protein